MFHSGSKVPTSHNRQVASCIQFNIIKWKGVQYTESSYKHFNNFSTTKESMTTSQSNIGNAFMLVQDILDLRYLRLESMSSPYKSNEYLFTGGNRTKLPSSRWRRRGRSLQEVFACSCFFATTDISQIYNRETRRHDTPCFKTTDSYLFSFLYNNPRKIRHFQVIWWLGIEL